MDKELVIYIIGQILGVVAVLIGILSYQMKRQENLLKFKLLNSIVKTFNELLTGALTGAALHVVGAIKYPVYMVRNKKGKDGKLIPIIFTLITAIVGIITWTKWYSVFVFSGMVIHAFCMSFKDAQKVRYSVLITSPLIIVYNILTYNYAGVVYEAFVITSSVIGIIRYRKTKLQEEN